MFAHRSIVVTGASSGIGRQISIDCNLHGARTILIGRDNKALQQTQRLCTNPENVSILCHDLVNLNLRNIKEQVSGSSDGIFGVVHCAGVSRTLPLKLHTSAVFEDSVKINILGGLNLIYTLGDELIEGGSVVFVSSIMSLCGQIAKHSYCASKGAIDGAIRDLALYLAHRKIRVNSILPGVVKTPLADILFSKLPSEAADSIINMHPLGLGSVEDIADMVIFLLSDKSKYINGQNIVIDGGYSIQ